MHTFGSLHVHPDLSNFVEKKLLVGLSLDRYTFWSEFEKLLTKFSAQNDQLLYERDVFQSKLDTWYKSHPKASSQEQQSFLESIGYLLPPLPYEPIQTQGLDDEISSIPAPQLVCPADNARYALNAVNARYVSLLDAFYGSDIIPNKDQLTKTKDYNPQRGLAVFEKVHQFLDEYFPLVDGSFNQANGFMLKDGLLHVRLLGARQQLLKILNLLLLSAIELSLHLKSFYSIMVYTQSSISTQVILSAKPILPISLMWKSSRP